MRTLLILILLCTPVLASDTKSGFDPSVDFSPFVESPDTPQAFPVDPPPVAVQPPSQPEDSQEVQSLLLSLREEAGKLRAEVAEFNKPKPSIPEASWTKSREYLTLEERVSKLEREQMTEKRVRELAQDEIQKALVKLRLPNGATKELSVPVNQSGFHLNPGETIIAIDGVPVQSMAPIRDPVNYGFQAYSGVSGQYRMQAAPAGNGYNVRIAAPPRARLFRAPVCANGRCG